jgi:hypothetical protein
VTDWKLLKGDSVNVMIQDKRGQATFYREKEKKNVRNQERGDKNAGRNRQYRETQETLHS